MAATQHLLIINMTERMPEILAEVTGELGIECLEEKTPLREDLVLDAIWAAVVVLDNSATMNRPEVFQTLELLGEHSIAALVMNGNGQNAGHKKSKGQHVVFLNNEETKEVLKGRLAGLLHMRPLVTQLQRELGMLRQISEPLNNHFSQVSEEMQLAARLQRDFLPRSLPEVAGVKFATIFRPASWVSGDIYDIMRLDEDHIGFYVADAVGHGMPAALLTMFIKRSLITKRIVGKSYKLIEPGEALAQLNTDLVNQELSNFQFATCCYGILNFQTLEVRIASGGHPLPMYIDRQAAAHEVPVSGRLLGIFPELSFDTYRFTMKPGEKLLIYSDGVESAFVNEGPDKPLRFRREFGNLANYDVAAMCEKLVTIIEGEIGSLHPRDDVTIVALETAERT